MLPSLQYLYCQELAKHVSLIIQYKTEFSAYFIVNIIAFYMSMFDFTYIHTQTQLCMYIYMNAHMLILTTVNQRFRGFILQYAM